MNFLAFLNYLLFTLPRADLQDIEVDCMTQQDFPVSNLEFHHNCVPTCSVLVIFVRCYLYLKQQ